MGKIIGIDLGTTNSEVAVLAHGQPVVIPDTDGQFMLPSYVGMSREGQLLLGEKAKNQYAAFPDRTIRSIKRMMGKNIQVDMAGEKYSPQEISAIILKELKSRAENYLGRQVEKAVITVPAYFSDVQRQATKEAGEIAGLEVVKMINEPTAAALAYEGNASRSQTMLIYDLGGGTFDVSVVRMEKGIVEVLASHGNNYLGGDDFDQLLMEHVLEQLRAEHGEFELDAEAVARLSRSAEEAKIILSDNPFAKIEEEFLFEKKGVPVHLSLEVSRDEYVGLIDSVIDETMETVHLTLKSADLVAADIDEILLVGGSTKTPVIGNRLQEFFKIQPRGEINPDLCVACGAAIQAGILSGDDVAAVLVDITPYTFGTSALGEFPDGTVSPYLYVPVIQKNTPVPVKKSDVFYTSYDGQEKVVIKVYQGENDDARENIKLGEFFVEGLSDVRIGNEIVITFELDGNGMLHVTAIEKRTGLKKDIRIESAFHGLGEEEVDRVRGKLVELFEKERQKEGDGGLISQTDLVKAQALMDKVDGMLDDVLPEDAEDLNMLVEQIKDALETDDSAGLAKLTDELAEIIFYLEV